MDAKLIVSGSRTSLSKFYPKSEKDSGDLENSKGQFMPDNGQLSTQVRLQSWEASEQHQDQQKLQTLPALLHEAQEQQTESRIVPSRSLDIPLLTDDHLSVIKSKVEC